MATTTKSNKKKPDYLTLRRQLGSNVFKKQPYRPFNDYNTVSGYYYGKYQNSMNHMENTGNGYKLSGQGGAAGSGGSEDVNTRNLPPGHNRNPDGTLNTNPVSKSEQNALVQRQAITDRIEKLKADVKAMNFANVDEKDIINLFGEQRANDLIYNFKIVDREMRENGYLSSNGKLAQASIERILSTTDTWDNVIPPGYTVPYSQLFPKAGVDASWRTEFIDVGIYFYELATNPFSPLGTPYERQAAMALANTYLYGNTVSDRDLQVGLELVENINGLDLVEMERHKNWAENKDYFYDLANGTTGTPSERKAAGEVYAKLEKGELLTPDERIFAEKEMPWITTAISNSNFATDAQKQAALREIMGSKNYSIEDKKAIYTIMNEGLTGETIGFQIAMQEYQKAREKEWVDTFGFSPNDIATMGGTKPTIPTSTPKTQVERTNIFGEKVNMNTSTQGDKYGFWNSPGALLNPVINPLGDKQEVKVGDYGKQLMNIWFSQGTLFSPGSTEDVVRQVNAWTRSFSGIEYDLETGTIRKSNPTMGDNASVIATVFSLLGLKGGKTTTGTPPSEIGTVIPKTKSTLFTGIGQLWDDVVRAKSGGSKIGSTIVNGVKSLFGKTPETKNAIMQMDDGTIQIFKNTDGRVTKVVLDSADAANDYIKNNGLKIGDFKIVNGSQVLDASGNFKIGFQKTVEIPFEGGTYTLGTTGYRVFDKVSSTVSNAVTHHPKLVATGTGVGGGLTVAAILKGAFTGMLGLSIATEPGSQSAFAAFIGGDTLNQLTSYKLIPSDTVPLLSAMAAYNGYNRVLNDLVLPMKNFQDSVEKLPIIPEFYSTYMPGWNNAKHIMDTQVNVQAKGAAETYYSLGLLVNKHSGTRDFSNSDLMLDGEFVGGKDYQEYLKAQEELSARINPYWSMDKIMEQKDRLGNPFNTTLFKADTYNHRYVKTEMFDTLYRAVEDDKAIARYDQARKTVEIKPELREYIQTGNINKLIESGRADVRSAVIQAAKDGMITEEQKNTLLKEVNKMESNGGGGGQPPNIAERTEQLKTSGVVQSVTGNFNDIRKEDLSPQQQIAFDVLKGATDVSQVEKVARDLGIDYSGRLNFSTDKSVEGQKMAVLNTIRENENSPFTIDRRDKNIYAPAINQERSNYFTKVQQPETIKWDSKYVPQAATYGGQGAFNYVEPETYRDPERPWLDDYYDAKASTPSINWNDFVSQNYQPTANFHPASMYGSNLNPIFNQGNYPQGYNTPQIITQPTNAWWDDSINVWDLGMAELMEVIEYDPVEAMKKDKKT